MIASDSIDLFSQNEFWNERQCKSLCEIAQTSDVEVASIYRHGKVQMDPGFRKTRRIKMEQPVIEEIRHSFFSIMPRLQKHFQMELRELQMVQFLQYLPGDYFRTHADETEPPSDSSRKISIILFLNSQYEGGDLVLYKDREHYLAGNGIRVPAEEGLLIAFSPYLLHEVQEVISGVRYSLVSWFF